MNVFKNNTMSNFTTILTVPLRFDVPYEVALVEITYRHTWHIPLGKLEIDLKANQEIETFEIELGDGEHIEKFAQRLNSMVEERYLRNLYNERYKRGQAIAKGETFEDKLGTLPYASYDDPNPNNRQVDVVEEIRKTDQFKSIPRFALSNNRFLISNIGNAHLRFSGDIVKIINVTSQWIYGKTHKHFSGELITHNPMLTQVIYVYTDIIQDQLIGDTYGKLLRAVVVDSEYMKTAWNRYDTPHYVKLNKTEINTIQIELRDDSGEQIKFKEGKVVVKLHFRPMKYEF
jgi:hypothetical protein